MALPLLQGCGLKMGNIPTYTSKAPITVARPNAPLVSNQAISQIEQLGQHYIKRQEEDNAVSVMKAEMAYSAWEDGYQYNQDSGVLVSDKFKGANAKGLYDQYQLDADKTFNEIVSGLDNQQQKDAFTARYGARLDQGRDRIAKYESVQVEDDRKASLAAFSQMEVSRAVGLYNDGDKAGATSSLNMSISVKMQEMKTASQPEKDLAKLGIRTAFHKEVFDAMVVDDPDGARSYLKANKKDIESTVFNDLESASKKAVDVRQSQDHTDRIIALGGTLEEQLIKARKLKGDIRDQTVRRVKVRYAEQVAAKKEAVTALVNDFWDRWVPTANIDNIPANLPGKARIEAIRYAEAFAKGKQPKTNLSVYEKVFTMPAAKLAKANLNDYRNTLSPTDFKAAVKRKNDAVNNPDKPDDAGTLTQQIAAVTNELKWTGTSNAAKRGLFHRNVRNEVEADIQRLGRNLSYEEREKILDRMTLKVVTDDGWFDDTEKAVGILTDKEREAFSVSLDDVDATAKKQAKESLELKGVAVTDENLKGLITAEQLHGQSGVAKWFKKALEVGND
ncbi:MAG: hypothetical protein GY832_17580 [Chloroflexi bacterium]|nr:hypothetical protein [Chloroflexota bacterium]